MSKTQTETVETAYGSVDVELAECDSCGNRVREEETVPFTIGDREGVACGYCEDEGPMSFPEKVGDVFGETLFLAVCCVPLSPLIALVGLLLEGEEDSDGTGMLVAAMFFGGLFWTTVVFLAVFPVVQRAVFGALPF